MKAVLVLPDAPDCAEAIAKDSEYAAAKIAYYGAARQAMPVLLQNAKGQKTDSRYGSELTEIFRGFREDRDEEATGTLETKLEICGNSERRDKALLAVERAKETAEQFTKDFGRLDAA